MGPDITAQHQDDSARAEVQSGIGHVEDTLNDHLPDGYYCKIEE